MNVRCVVGYMTAMHAREQREMAYMVYVTESLRLLPQRKCLSKPFVDVINPKREVEVDANEIVSDVVSRAGLVVRA